MKCEICGKEILRDSQCINYKYYHNDCIENLQQENKKLKMINEEYERLNKEKYRGFKIIDVQEYDRYELLSYKNYKNNWLGTSGDICCCSVIVSCLLHRKFDVGNN